MDPEEPKQGRPPLRVCSVCGKAIAAGVGHFVYMDKATCIPCHEAERAPGSGRKST